MSRRRKFMAKEFLPFKQARAIVHRLDLRGIEWREYNRPGTPYWGLIPVHPDRAYRGKGWVDWTDWFGNRRQRGQWRSFKAARKFARGLGFQKISEWKAFYKTDKRPADIPTDPSVAYQEAGWTNWQDFLGYKLARLGWVGRRGKRTGTGTTKSSLTIGGMVMGKEKEGAKVWKGFLKFTMEGGDEVSQSLFISIHRKKCIQLSKGLYERLGLGKRRYYVELLYSPAEDKVGLEFTTEPGKSRMRLGSSGRNFGALNFCKRFRIPGTNQTQLPVELLRGILGVKAKLRRGKGQTGPTRSEPVMAPAGKKRQWGGRTQRKPAWPVFQAEVAKVLAEAKKPLSTAEVTEVLVSRSVFCKQVPAATEEVRDRVSAAVSRFRAVGKLNWQFGESGKRVYIWKGQAGDTEVEKK
jgi:hypothetical protein